MGERVVFSSPSGVIRYEDSLDHFENGLLRLLNLNRDQFADWLRAAEQSAARDLLAQLADGFAVLHGDRSSEVSLGEDVEPGPLGAAGTLWHASIAENRGFG